MNDDLLNRAVRVLSDPVDTPRALRDLAALLVENLVDWCLVDVLQPPDLVTRVVALGRDGPLSLPLESGSVDARRSSAQALGALSLLLDTPGRRLRVSGDQLAVLIDADDPRTRSQARLARSLGTTDVVVLGLAHRDQVLGVLTVGLTTGCFDAAQIELLSDLAAVAGLCLDDLRLRELERGVSTALQLSLLPRLPVVPGITFAARFTTAAGGLAVGGDWYDVFVLPDGDIALVVGDATGHDVQAATRMAELRNLLRAVAVDRQDGPGTTLSRLDSMAALLAPELSGTCVYGRLDRSGVTTRLTWSSAGHLPPVLLRDGRAHLLETHADLMLGVRVGSRRTDHVDTLEPADVLVLYTDGLVEDRRASLDQRLGVLTRLVESVGARDVERLADLLVEQMPTGQDDVAVLVCRIDGPDR